MSDEKPEGNPTVAEIFLDYLKAEEVEYVFGMPGGAIKEVIDLIRKRGNKPNFIIIRHEAAAGYIADGYYRACGKLGVVLTTTGPGATNALTGVMNADSAGSPQLMLSGEAPESSYGKGYLQEGAVGRLDVRDVFEASIRSSSIISSPDNAKTLIEMALRTIWAIPHRAAHLSLPDDVSRGVPEAPFEVPKEHAKYRTDYSFAEHKDADKALRLLAKSKRPLLMLGNGCRKALENPKRLEGLMQFVTDRGIAVMTTADGKGVFPEDHDNSLGVFGFSHSMHPLYWMTQKDPKYDALMVIGSNMGDLATGRWSTVLPPKDGDGIIQVDANPRMLGRIIPLEHGIVAEAGAFIDLLLKGSKTCAPPPSEIVDRTAKIKEVREHSPYVCFGVDYHSNGPRLHPAAVCRVMNEVLPVNPRHPTYVMLDSGNCVGWGLHYLEAVDGRQVHASLDMGPMGFGVCAVIGAKLGKPMSPCVALVGDGAFMMHGAEVSTAAQNNVGAVWVVLQDNDLNMVSQGMANIVKDTKRAEWEELYALGSPDLQKFSEGLGADAETVHSPRALKTALEEALDRAAKDSKPQVVIARIEADPVPPYYNNYYGKGEPPGPDDIPDGAVI